MVKIKADRFPQRVQHWAILMIFVLSVIAFNTENKIVIGVIAVLITLAIFSDEIISLFKRQRNDEFLHYDGRYIELLPYTFLNKGKLMIDTEDVVKVRESGVRGKRIFQFWYTDGSDQKLDLSYLLGQSFSEAVEDEVFSLLKERFGELEHVYQI